MEASSSIFVNREEELQQISEAVEILRDQQQLLRTPIIEFKGVSGIGKTALLHRVKAIYEDHIFCVMSDASRMTGKDFDAIELQANERPIVIILDALEEIDIEQLQTIETRLETLVDKTRTLVILASRELQTFENTRSLAKKLTLRTLEPLQLGSSRQYLDNFPVSRAARDSILSWTQGYPLAMKVMTDAVVNEGLDPTNEQEQRQLLEIVVREVIDNKLLTNVTNAKKVQIQTLLPLLSLPRRFNLILMKDLIEEFARQYKQDNSFSYITLPKTINDPTSTLSWNLERAGYSVDMPVRNLLKLWYKIERPQDYVQIHKFLANKNGEYARGVRDVDTTDYVRYLREVLYHLACYEEQTKLQESLTQYIEQLVEVRTQEGEIPLQSLGNFFQFYEEFQQDSELKEALNERDAHNARFVLSLIYKNFMRIYPQIPENVRGEWLKDFFGRVTQKQENNDFASVFEEGIHQITQQVAKEDVKPFYTELIGDRELAILLGAKINEVQALLSAELALLSEGE